MLTFGQLNDDERADVLLAVLDEPAVPPLGHVMDRATLRLLHRGGVYDTAQLVAMTRADVLRLPGVGPVTAKWIEYRLRLSRLALKASRRTYLRLCCAVCQRVRSERWLVKSAAGYCGSVAVPPDVDICESHVVTAEPPRHEPRLSDAQLDALMERLRAKAGGV